MDRVRRIIMVGMAVALAHFGVIASSPAHAHAHDETADTVHALALDPHAGHAHDHDAGRHPAANHGDHEADRPQSSDGCGDRAPCEQGAHSHAFPQLAPVNEASVIAPMAWAASSPAPLTAGAVSRAAAPPLRPPRAFL